jgi:hypothetical protein
MRVINIPGSHVNFKLKGRQSKAVFHFEVRGYKKRPTI